MSDEETTAWAQAAKLAMELECVLLSCQDTCAVSKWWDTGMAALEEYRQVSHDAYARLEPTMYFNQVRH